MLRHFPPHNAGLLAACMSRKDLVPAVPYSWFPFPGTRGEHTWGSRATKRSWAHVAEGDALGGWAMPTISASALRAVGSRGRSHLLLRHLLFGLASPGSAAITPVGLVRHSRLGNELSAIALVDTCFTVGVDLALVVVVDAGTCRHSFVVGVVRARESTVELKLHGIMLPFLSKIIQR